MTKMRCPSTIVQARRLARKASKMARLCNKRKLTCGYDVKQHLVYVETDAGHATMLAEMGHCRDAGVALTRAQQNFHKANQVAGHNKRAVKTRRIISVG